MTLKSSIKPLFAIAGVVAALLVGEVTIRAYNLWRGTFELKAWQEHFKEHGLYMKAADPELRYQHRSNHQSHQVPEHVHTNAQGILRPHDVSRVKDEDTLRVALVGDSLSAALHLRHEQRFAALLEVSLTNEPLLEHTGVEVLNFGVAGYSSSQEACLVETQVMGFEPDVILLQYCLNDPGVSMTPNRWFFDAPPPKLHLVEFIARRFGVYTHPMTMPFVPAQGPRRRGDDYWTPLYAPTSSSWRSVVQAFERIAAAAATHDIPVLLVVFPLLLDDSYPPGVTAPFHAQVSDLGAAQGWAVVDLLEAFAEHPVEHIRKLQANGQPDVYHPNAAGNVIAARQIHQAVLGMLTGGPTPAEASYRPTRPRERR